ncbi:MAG: LysR family transcriptional regulator [Psychrobacter sp.]|jgi:DNA-binding transcriptional LysR family regulator|uniref:LysR family transcriptional regulator n=1 Tax=Psychrobacter TaxID=497 RepID=UPI000411BE8D|nr:MULTISPECIES: LysR family transcriptional regulator [unclassified Psychrobacter]MAE40398.1 LysR family transcriptional regulator [Psychrobacter sp.]|tara:strand:+ start:856 stop:1755 length:900 start_codon:yes stop_codon:yes gene_type:complete
MLDNLRGMAVFASVVEHGSFSGSARELGITTSAVSQQIRSLENELGVVLLHRSTRKLSLTEAGESFYESAKDVVSAAEQGRIKVNQLRDELAGSLRIATTPELGVHHILPALSTWMAAHDDLSITYLADNRYVDMIDERIDIAVRMSPSIDNSALSSHPLSDVRQLLVASPQYLRQHKKIESPKDLADHQLICIDIMQDASYVELSKTETSKKTRIKMDSRIHTNNVFMALTLAKEGHGIIRIMEMDVKRELENGNLVEVLTGYQLPSFVLYAVTLNREQQPAKITRCLEVLKKYFHAS